MNASILSSFRSLAFLAFPLAAIFAACNSPTDVVIGTDQKPISCNTDANCPSNQSCVAGFCDPQSGTTGSGNGGMSGTSASNGCTTDAECPMGQLCFNGACQIGTSAATGGMGGSNPNACMTDAECPMGQLCFNGACQIGTSAATGGMGGSNPNACMSNADCAMGQQTCVNGVCTNIGACMTDSDCPMGQLCFNSVCQVGTSATTGSGMGCMGMLPKPEICDGIDNDCDGVVDNGASCGNNANCINGACVAVGACMSDADCAMGQQTCVAGVCQNLVFCMTNAQCAPPLTCQSGVCKP